VVVPLVFRWSDIPCSRLATALRICEFGADPYVGVHREIQSKLGVLELENRDLWPNIETNLKQVAHASIDIEPSVGCQREFPSRITAVLDG
jgi:hypothetical protein